MSDSIGPTGPDPTASAVARTPEPPTVAGHGHPPRTAAERLMAARRRATAGKRWSANATVTLYGRDGSALPADTTVTPHRAQVRWRLDGRQRKRTLTTLELPELPGFLADLRAAYEHDWDADARGWPLHPRPLPLDPTTPADGFAADDDADAPALLPLVAPDDVEARPDVANIVARYLHHLETTRSPRTGRPRSQSTLRDYRYELGFAVDVLRYSPGDPRVEVGDVEVGDPLLLTDLEHGVRPSDLLAFLEYRERSNRNIAARNERLMARWVKAVEKEERRAAREGRAPTLPEPPVMEAEVAEPRTVEAAGKLLKAMLTAAKGREWIDYQPWTKDVDDCLIKPAPTAYTRKSVHRRDQVDRIVSAIGEQTREAVIDGAWTEVDGDRYRAPVMLAGYLAPRPEELFAIRRSWFEFERARPRVVLHNAEVDGKVVPLKHRRPGEVRYLYFDDEPELLVELRRHLEVYVPEPDPSSDDPDARDPYVFTTHRGGRINIKHFGRRWYKPAVQAALTGTGEGHLAASTLHLLRASAITHWLAVDGWSIHRCAEAAGNTIAVIEKHYKGVLADIDGDVPRDARGGSTPVAPSSAQPLADALEEMDAATLASVAALAAKLLGERATGGPS
ncbi:site-specific integrase [Nitriliruptoraceae bacterium ZYF776]|nr:site-specific integrase [Profundirhabdus halotolerans]